MGRRAIVLLVAVVLAGLAAWAVWNFMQGVQTEAQEGQEIVNVYVAGPDGIDEGAEGDILLSALESNSRCQDADLEFAGALACPIKRDTDQAEDVPDNAFREDADLREFLSGKVAAGPIAPKAVLTRSQWTEVTADVISLSDQIPSGKQAITIRTDNIQGVNGFIEAGDRINMILTIGVEISRVFLPLGGATVASDAASADDAAPPSGDTEEQKETVTLTRFVLQGITVLAAGRDIRQGDGPVEVDVTEDGAGEEVELIEEDTGNSTVFTLVVTPDQAERIVYAFENGSVWLTLAPPDFVEAPTTGVTINSLFDGDLSKELSEEVFGSGDGN